MKRLTEAEFNSIKRGLKLGHSRIDVAKDVKRSKYTVATVAQSSSYHDYCLRIAKNNSRRPVVKEVKVSLFRKVLNFFQ